MATSQKKNKEKVLGIRLKEEDYLRFSEFCENDKKSMSQIARKAIQSYMYIIFNPLVNPKLIFAKNQFAHILSCLTEKEINELVTISIGNGTVDMGKLEDYHPKTKKENKNKTEVNYQIETLVKYVFSDDGENWFDEIKYEFHENALTISGIHTLGPNFSIYVRKLLEGYVGMHGYFLTEESSGSVLKKNNRSYNLLLKFCPGPLQGE